MNYIDKPDLNSIHYADTAFDSRHDEFSSYSKSDFEPSIYQKWYRKNKVPINLYINDFNFLCSSSELDCLREKNLDDLDLNFQRYFYGFYTCMTTSSIGCLRDLLLISVFLFPLLALADFFLTFIISTGFSTFDLIFITSSLVLFKIYQYTPDTFEDYDDRVYPKPEDAKFDRFTGMLLIRNKTEIIEIPFHELDAYSFSLSTNNGARYGLHLAHRYSNYSYKIDTSMHLYNLLGKLSYLVRFMDISRPLPNLPLLVTDRHKDPKSQNDSDQLVSSRKHWEQLTEDEMYEMTLNSLDKLKRIYGSN